MESSADRFSKLPTYVRRSNETISSSDWLNQSITKLDPINPAALSQEWS